MGHLDQISALGIFYLRLKHNRQIRGGFVLYRQQLYCEHLARRSDTPCSMYGQYVIYYNERLPNVTYPYPDYYDRNVFNSLCDVEVNGTYFTRITG